MAENTYMCEGCGGIYVFDARSQKLKCPNCGNEREITYKGDGIIEHPYTGEAVRRYSKVEKVSATFVCTGCGATVEMSKDDTSAKCPYCGSQYVMADKQESLIIPDGVVPFTITEMDAKEALGAWIKSRWLAPGSLKALYQRGTFQGRYIPFWTFDADASAQYHGEGGKDRTEHYKDKDGNDHTRTVTDWYPVSGHVYNQFDDVKISGTENLSAKLVDGMENYDLYELKEYSPDYFSGFLSESYTVDLKSAHTKAISQMEAELRSLAESQILTRYDRARNVRVNATYQNETYKHIMTPLYATSYAFKNKNYTVLINGQTSKVKGEYPKSPYKIGLIIIAIIAAIAAFYYLFLRDDVQDKTAMLEVNTTYAADVLVSEKDGLNSQDDMELPYYIDEDGIITYIC